MRTVLLMVLLELSLLSAPAQAETPLSLAKAQADAGAGTPLSLAKAQAEARAHAPEVGELEAQVHASDAAWREARRPVRTDPSFSVMWKPPYLLTNQADHLWDISLSWQVDVSGSWRTRGQAAAQGLEQVRLSREDGLRALDEAVAIAVADLALSQGMTARAQRLQSLAEMDQEQIRKQVAAGALTELDLDAAQLDLLAQQAQVIDAGRQQEQARTRLARLLGRDSGEGLEVEEGPEPFSVPDPVQIATYVDQDPRVAAAAAELRSAKLELESFNRTLWPAPILAASYGHGRRNLVSYVLGDTGATPTLAPPNPEVAFSVTFNLPIFERQGAGQVQSMSRRWAAEAHLALVRADVRAELETNVADLKAAEATWRLAMAAKELVKRDLAMVEQASRKGKLDALERTQNIRRLEDEGERIDNAVYKIRLSRAACARRMPRPRS